MNNVVLVGRLVGDPELKYTTSNTPVIRFTVAVNRLFKNAQGEYETDFINCKSWDGIAKNTAEYCRKGDQIAINGRIQNGKYQDQNGNTKYYTEVVAEKITFLSKNKKPAQQQTPVQQPVEEQTDIYTEFGAEIDDNFID